MTDLTRQEVNILLALIEYRIQQDLDKGIFDNYSILADKLKAIKEALK